MTDWPALIEEIVAAGVSKSEIARRMDVPRTTLLRWHDGTGKPKEGDAQRLRALHRSLTSQRIRTYEGSIMTTSTLMRQT